MSSKVRSVTSASLDLLPHLHVGNGKQRLQERRFSKGFSRCVYQEETTDLPLEEGPGSLLIHVSILKTIRGHFIDNFMERHRKSESVLWSAPSLKGPSVEQGDYS